VGVHGIWVDGSLHSLPGSHGVCSLEPGGQKFPRSHGVAAVDSCGHIAPAGHGSSVNVVGHVFPGGHGSCWVAPGKQIEPLSHAAGVDELGLLQKNPSGHGEQTTSASGRQWETV